MTETQVECIQREIVALAKSLLLFLEGEPPTRHEFIRDRLRITIERLPERSPYTIKSLQEWHKVKRVV